MASRAHAVRQYSFGSTAPGARREIWYRREDPVVLPRSRGWSIDYRLIAAALAASALVATATYGAYYTAPPALAETPTESANREWQPDTALASASATKALNGPLFAAPSVSTVEQPPSEEVFFDGANTGTQESLTPDPSSRGSATDLPDPSRLQPSLSQEPIPYPNPTTTPPDAIAPTETPANEPAETDPDNPYR
jgi:hypothetical protein